MRFRERRDGLHEQAALLHLNAFVQGLFGIVVQNGHCRLGEAVAAQIELTPGASYTEEEVLDYCQGLPRFERPLRVFFGPVPRNPTGKIEKQLLQALYQNEPLPIRRGGPIPGSSQESSP